MKRLLKIVKWVPNNVHESIYPLIFINWLSIFGFSGYPLGGTKYNKFRSIPGIILFGILCWTICKIFHEYVQKTPFAYAVEGVFITDTIIIFAAHINGWINFKVP
ncbi:uncharacterized protein LOC122505243 [Leptopilina heterotoma]|uniref:uncharacterized protein LOC122505243 n=1 Tax=Leptopilina heterotoma TaxID=63436 RepID=UPI001CA903FD|nr:uncharacterized protein LOC122505243 [Leptopilina heterotoma]